MGQAPALSRTQLGETELKNGKFITVKAGTCCVCGQKIDPKWSSGISIGDRCRDCYYDQSKPAFVLDENIRIISHKRYRGSKDPSLITFNDYTDIVCEILVDGVWLRASSPQGNGIIFEEGQKGRKDIPFWAAIGYWDLAKMIDQIASQQELTP